MSEEVDDTDCGGGNRCTRYKYSTGLLHRRRILASTCGGGYIQTFLNAENCRDTFYNFGCDLHAVDCPVYAGDGVSIPSNGETCGFCMGPLYTGHRERSRLHLLFN